MSRPSQPQYFPRYSTDYSRSQRRCYNAPFGRVQLPPQKDLLQLMIEAKKSKVDVTSVTSEQLTAADENEHELKILTRKQSRFFYAFFHSGSKDA